MRTVPLCLALTLTLPISAWADPPAPAEQTDLDEAAAEKQAITELRGIPSNLQLDRDTGRVRFLRFSKPIVENRHLESVASFRKLRYLAVVVPSVDDQGLKHIAKLQELEVLLLADSGVTDGSMEIIAGLPKLRRLYLDRTAVTDAALAAVGQIQSLETLSLDGTGITGAGLASLADLQQLQTLSLRETNIDDTSLAALAELESLQSLSLDKTPITGAGLESLAGLPKLETLSLCYTELDATGVEALAKLSQLKRVVLWNAKLPKESLEQLAEASPKTKFHTGGQPTPWQRLLAGEPLRGPQGSASQLEPDKLAEPAEIAASIHERLDDQTPDFQRHVLPLLGRLGCNGRTCHGSFQGQGGFRLSMFGYDFAADHEALTAGDEPRVSLDTPAESLILYKPTHGDEHGGGQRLELDSWQYRLLHRWVAAGAQGVESPRKLLRLDVEPRELVFERAGQTAQLRTTAVWADGSREDVTSLTRFQSNDTAVVEVDKDGLATCLAPGETHVISFYDRGVAATQLLLPLSDRVGENFPDVEASTEIDRLIVDKLSKLGVVPSPRCSDEEFLRRVSLDIAGTLPTPAEVEEFVADASPDKRLRAIDRLLDSPAYVEWWTLWLTDLTGSNPQYLGSTDMNRPAAEQWTQWLRRRVKDNDGWDRIAAGILLATSREPGQTYDEYAAQESRFLRRESPDDFAAPGRPMHYYWFRSNNQLPADRALSFGYIFLGVRLQCAQCHKHPFDQWSQQDFEQFSEFFKRVRTGEAPDAADAFQRLRTRLGVPERLNTAALRRQMYLRVAAEGLPIPWREVYLDPPGPKPQTARILGGDPLDLNDYDDPREPLVAWLLADDNYYFPRAMVNRIWKHYLGTGIVEPPDDFNMANPPSNAALLDHLAEQFVERGYDLKWLHRAICSSDAYQRSWRTNDTNRADTRNFSRAVLRRLPAEVTVDAILQATAKDQLNAAWSERMEGRKITQHPISIQARSIDYSLLIFGKPLRTTNCDCERQEQPTLLQSLYVRNDDELIGWLERSDGWLQQVAAELGQELSVEAPGTAASPKPSKTKKPSKPKPPADDQAAAAPLDQEKLSGLIQQAYLRTLSRRPSDDELQQALAHLGQLDQPVEGLRDLMWALLNTKEFLTNH